jgi:hypothetical protein
VIVRSPLVGLVSMVVSALILTSCSNRLAFGTATKFGVDVSQRPDQTVEMVLGYDRAEVVVIPMPEAAKDATETKDTYAVMGTFQVKHGNPFTGGALIIHQFFATGRAAVKAAQDPRFQEIFGTAAGDIYQQGRVDAR